MLAPHLIYDQTEQRQVGAGALVLVHPGAVAGWVRDGWCEIADDEPDSAPGDSTANLPNAPRRRAANKKAASGN